MKCPHCLTAFHHLFPQGPLVRNQSQLTDKSGHWNYKCDICPTCNNAIIYLYLESGKGQSQMLMVYPRGTSREPLSPHVPDEFTADYKEACLVLPYSPKASAALSRRCLQHLLREKGQTKAKDLAPQIDEVLPHLPSYLAKMIDTVRVIGNFAAHPIKSTNTGEIIEVEDGEAEWLLDSLESAFDFYFVQPEIARQKREAINKKLTEAGKPPLK